MFKTVIPDSPYPISGFTLTKQNLDLKFVWSLTPRPLNIWNFDLHVKNLEWVVPNTPPEPPYLENSRYGWVFLNDGVP